ncbi:hypothetical protein GCM10025734_00620 [Kitasatospora paranensis]
MPSSALIERPAPEMAAASAGAAPRRRTRIVALPEARWAAASTALFLIALPLQLTGAPAWVWGPLYALAYATGGWEPAWAGLQSLREKTLDVDLLMIVAALGAAAVGQVMDGALLIVIFATSGALEAIATARTADSVHGLLDLAPATATRLLDDGAEETVPTEALEVGDTVLVRPGERIGADGRVLDGASDVGQATITGEPLPVAKVSGGAPSPSRPVSTWPCLSPSAGQSVATATPRDRPAAFCPPDAVLPTAFPGGPRRIRPRACSPPAARRCSPPSSNPKPSPRRTDSSTPPRG